MKNFSNTYIFTFSLIMVVVVAVLLSFVAMQLKPRQQMNQEIERKSDILQSVGEAREAADVKDYNAFIEQEARNKLSLIKPNEQVFVVQESFDRPEPETVLEEASLREDAPQVLSGNDQASNMAMWLDLIF